MGDVLGLPDHYRSGTRSLASLSLQTVVHVHPSAIVIDKVSGRPFIKTDYRVDEGDHNPPSYYGRIGVMRVATVEDDKVTERFIADLRHITGRVEEADVSDETHEPLAAAVVMDNGVERVIGDLALGLFIDTLKQEVGEVLGRRGL